MNKFMLLIVIIFVFIGCNYISYHSNEGENNSSIVKISRKKDFIHFVNDHHELNIYKEHALFENWNSEPDGSGKVYLPDDQILYEDRSIILYAQWSDSTKITYDINSDIPYTFYEVETYRIGDKIYFPGEDMITHPGLFISGWSTNRDGSGRIYNSGDILTDIAPEQTLYAQWEKYDNQYYYMIDFPYEDKYKFHFQMGAYEVTLGLWETVCDWAGNHWEGNYGYRLSSKISSAAYDWAEVNNIPITTENDLFDVIEVIKNYPVENRNIEEVLVWCNAFNEMVGYEPVYVDKYGSPITNTDGNPDIFLNIFSEGYRLPKYSEWLYAATYNDGLSFSDPLVIPGDELPYSESMSIKDFAWYSDNSQGSTYVGKKLPTLAGLYDIAGNVSEWCWESDNNDSLRGGSWMSHVDDLLVGANSNFGNSAPGIRLVRTKFLFEDATPREKAIIYNNEGFLLYEKGIDADINNNQDFNSSYYFSRAAIFFKKAFESDSTYQYPYYNYACVKALLVNNELNEYIYSNDSNYSLPVYFGKYEQEEIEEALTRAIELNPSYKSSMRDDKDLIYFHDKAWFLLKAGIVPNTEEGLEEFTSATSWWEVDFNDNEAIFPHTTIYFGTDQYLYILYHDEQTGNFIGDESSKYRIEGNSIILTIKDIDYYAIIDSNGILKVDGYDSFTTNYCHNTYKGSK